MTHYLPFASRADADAFAAQAIAKGCAVCVLPTAGGFIVKFWDRKAA